MTVVRALSIRQPWIELILRGEKDVENRSWWLRTPGPLLLHASRTLEKAKVREYGLPELVTGCIVGMVDVRECSLEVRSPWHVLGHVGWYLENPRRFAEPIPYRAQVGIFHVDDALVAHACSELLPVEICGQVKG